MECGDGVREVTALVVATLKIAKRAADPASPTQSGDSEGSVAVVQNAHAPTRFALGSWSLCAVSRPWRLHGLEAKGVHAIEVTSSQKVIWKHDARFLIKSPTTVRIIDE